MTERRQNGNGKAESAVERVGRAIRPFDLYIGRRLRQRREECDLSQEALAKAVGLTGQQIQKYERGTSRVIASRLFDLAQALAVPMNYFFDGFPRDQTAPADIERLVSQLKKICANNPAAFATISQFVEDANRLIGQGDSETK